MKTLSREIIQRRVDAGLLKPTPDTVKIHRHTQVMDAVHDVAKICSDTANVFKDVGAKINENIAGLASDQSPVKKKWQFTVNRTADGLIDDVVATEI